MWIEAHEELSQHAKTYALSDALGVTNAHAVGLLICLWTWAVRNAVDGDLTRFPARAIEMAAGWKRTKGVDFVGAMVAAGWIDRDDDGAMRIHDWDDYAGKLIDQHEIRKNQSRVRQQRRRDKMTDGDARHADVTRDNSVTNGDVTRDVTHVSRPVTHSTVTLPYRNPTNVDNTDVDVPTCAREDGASETAEPVETVDNSGGAVDNFGGTQRTRRYAEIGEIARKVLWDAFGDRYSAYTVSDDAAGDVIAVAAMIAEEMRDEHRARMGAQERIDDAVDYIADIVSRAGLAGADAEYPAAYVRTTRNDWHARGIHTFVDVRVAILRGKDDPHGLSPGVRGGKGWSDEDGRRGA